MQWCCKSKPGHANQHSGKPNNEQIANSEAKYDYFSNNFGTKSKIVDSELQTKYDHLMKNQLKDELKRLKSQKSSNDTPNIHYVAELLHFKVASHSTLDKTKYLLSIMTAKS